MSLPNPAADTMVLVTGAAHGIGYELARQLASRGYNLFVVDRQGERLAEVADEWRREHRVEVTTHVCDLTVKRQRDALIAAVRRHQHSLVGLCNNAGVVTVGRFHELPYEPEAAEVAVNAVALHHLCGAFAGEMASRGTGAILNTTSLAGNQPLPRGATYSATKAFAHTFSECLAAELRGTGVSCTSLQPSATRTHIAQAAGVETEAALVPDFLWEDPEDVARVGIEAMIRGRRTAVPGLINRTLLVAFGRYVPRGPWLALLRTGGDRLFSERSLERARRVAEDVGVLAERRTAA